MSEQKTDMIKQRQYRDPVKSRQLRSYFLKRTFIGIFAASVATNGIMYGSIREREAQHSAEIEKIQQELEHAEHVKENALDQYNGILAEIRKRSRNCRQQEEEQSIAQTELKEEQEPLYMYIGECTITYYCAEEYPHICGNGDGLTATGAEAGPGIVAVDPNIIKLGSTVLIDGVEYIAEDTGGSVKGYHVDICTDTHAHALELGTHTADVWIVK